MKVGAVIVTYNSEDTIERCLDSVESEPLISDLVVVDNASADRSRELVPQDVLYPSDENLGFAKGVNLGVAKLPADWTHLLLLNPDAWLTEGALQSLARALEAGDQFGAAGPLNRYEDGHVAPTGWRFHNPFVSFALNLRFARLFPARARQRLFMSYYLPQTGPPLEVDWVFGSCILIRRKMWDQLGGLDETFFLFGEETDFFWRGAKLGWKVLFVPEAVVIHVGGYSAHKEFGRQETVEMHFRTTRQVARKHLPRLKYLLWLPAQAIEERRYRKAIRSG